MNKKRIFAIIGIILLVALYIATLVVACLDFEGHDAVFQGLLAGSIGIPILLWIYIWLFKKTKERKQSNMEQSGINENQE